MKRAIHLLIVAACASLALPAVAHEDGDADKDGIGRVSFPTSCTAKVQTQFERGVAKLHSYWFPEAAKAFDAVLQEDPGCAMAYWGKAVTLLENSLAAPPPLKNLEEASALLEKARTLGAKTQRERDWIDSIDRYYRDYDKVSLDKRLAAYADALQAMTQRYPDDMEVWVFYALMLQASAPSSDRTYANQRKSAEILERMFAKAPEHPGAAHYLIHAYDYPPLANKALDARPDYFHAMDFMTYAYLQLGQDTKARAMVDEMRRVVGDKAVTQGHTAVACIPARIALERGDWAAAAALPVTDLKVAYADSLTRFARGVGMARGGDLAGARGEIDALKALKQSLDKSSPYWAARTEEQIYAVSAWIARAEGERERAETLLRTAADGEDASVKNVQMENRLYPMRELYADLLLENGKAADALRQFTASLHETPNRYRGLYGAALAADATGDRATAIRHFEALMALTNNADKSRPEIGRAREYLAQK
jgi:tetratricopeptide (TPR) repeat protein